MTWMEWGFSFMQYPHSLMKKTGGPKVEKTKEQLTFFYTNAIDEKEKPLVICKSQQPQCFKMSI